MGAYRTKYIVDIYAMAREGTNEKTIAKTLGVSQAGFIGWKRRRKLVRYALRKAKKDRENTDKLSFSEYVAGKLPARLKPTWEKLTEYSNETNGYVKAQHLLKEKSTKTRQEILIYAILISGFNVSKALRKVSIPQSTYMGWLENDPDFVELIREVEYMKKDFFEEGLLKLIKAGDSPATIFANRTKNRDRGYGEVVENRLNATLDVRTLPICQLNLPPETLRVLLDAMKEHDRVQVPSHEVHSLPNITSENVSPSE